MHSELSQLEDDSQLWNPTKEKFDDKQFMKLTNTD